MKKPAQIVLEAVANGRIDKQTAVELLKSIKLEEKNKYKEIAIIGVAAKLPLSENIDEFLYNLRNRVDCVTDFPEERRKDSKGFEPYLADSEMGTLTFSKGGYLREIDKFDYKFFKMSPAEARLMDPNQRLFLQTAWEAIEDAGYGGKKLSGSNTGVYLGYNKWPAYAYCISREDMSAVSMALAGNLPAIIASRISYMLDLRGPSMLIDTACSSSLVAFYQACQALRTGECDQALVGGANIELLPVKGMLSVGIEASSELTKSFDDQADGAVWGEGVAAVLLKPLDRALKDGDSIYAVVKGVAANQDGASIGITAPNVLAQEELYVKAWEDAEVNPETITYIEAHGTATKLGDPIEIDGLTRAFRRYTNKKHFCAIGTAKTNIGHLNAAAGIVGIIKAALTLKYKELYPLLHFTKPNMNINFKSAPVYINNRLSEFVSNGHPRRCGVNGFGFSGTNCHIVLEEAPEIAETIEGIEEFPQILTISAKSKDALRGLVRKYKALVNSGKAWRVGDICYTANTGRGHYEYRIAVIAASRQDFIRKIHALDAFNIDENCIYYQELEAVQSEKNAVALDEEALCQSIGQLGQSHHQALEFLYQIGISYVKGGDVAWDLLYAGENRRRVHIPTYPFEKSRCWFEAFRAEKQAAILPKVKLYGRESGIYTDLENRVAEIWGEILGYEELKITNNFYELGGDSIYSARIVNKVNELLGTHMNVTDLLIHPTVEDLVKCIQEKYLAGESTQAVYSAIPQAENAAYYPLSSAQKRIFILYRINKEQLGYNIPAARLIEGNLDRNQFEKAFKALIHRHEAFRTTFELIDDEPCQVIHPQVDLDIEYFDMEGEAGDPKIKAVFKAFIRPFDLSRAPLFRVGLIKLAQDKHILVYDLHHIISDATTESILTAEFLRIYSGESLPPLRIQYKDFTMWQQGFLKSDAVKKQEEFWMHTFTGEIPVLNLPADYPRPPIQSDEGGSCFFEASEELTANLKKLSAKTGTTLYMVLLAVYNTLLFRYTGQEDIIVGSPIAGRSQGELEKVIGVFINTLAMRNFPQGDKKFIDFLDEVREMALRAYSNQDCQFEELVKRLDLKRDLSRNPLFDTMFILQNITREDISVQDLTFKPYVVDTGTASLDLALIAVEENKKISFSFQYCTKLFKRETMERFAAHFINILAAVSEDPGIRLCDIKMQSWEEQRQGLYGDRELRDEVEPIIIEVWKKVLGLESLGADDDFFDLGGDSILAMKLEIEMQKHDLDIECVDIFTYRTIRNLVSLF